MKHYILEGKEVKEVDLMTWGKYMEKPDRIIARTNVGDGVVSTVFMGIDHSFGYGPELLFETMVFDSGTELDREPFRYSTYEEAEKGHEDIVTKVKELLETNHKK